MSQRILNTWLRQLILNAVTITVVASMLFAYRAWAMPGSTPTTPNAAPGVISYQGTLTDASGQSVNGNTDITFYFYNVPTGGAALWTEAHTGSNAVPVSHGLFNVLLGSLTPIPSTVWSNDTVYLGVQVGSDPEMTPREVVGAAPRALTVPAGALSPAHLTAFANEVVDAEMRSTTASSFVDLGSSMINLDLPYRAMVYIYIRGSVRNPTGRSAVTLLIDSQDHFAGSSTPLYIEAINSEWRTMGAGAVFTLDAGTHTIRPRFGSLSQNTTAWAATVAYGYIVLGRAP